MNIPSNPYVAGNPVGGGPAFVGREDVLRDVHNILSLPQNSAVLLYGQRRIGKTSVLQELVTWLPKQLPCQPVYIDLQNKTDWSLGRLLQEVARAAAVALRQPPPALGSDPETTFRHIWPKLLKKLPDDQMVVLLFDEFDVLAEPTEKKAGQAFFPYLSSLLANPPARLKFVFVIGRNVGDLSTIALSLFKLVPNVRVSLLDQADTERVARLAEDNESLRWREEGLAKLWALTHGHPFLTQILCSWVWDQVYDDAPPDTLPHINPLQVEAAVAKTLASGRSALEWVWKGLPPAARVVVSALAEGGPDPISQERLEALLRESGVRVVIRELQNAPKLLEEWDLIEAVEGGYKFRVELLRRWLAKNKPLRRVQEELDQIEPVADNLYQAGLGLFRASKLKEAIAPLQQAVSLNPNHAQATRLLAEIQIAEGRLEEARPLLERLHEYQPTAARPLLVEMLLKEAKGLSENDAAIEDKYRQILTLDASHAEAKQGLVGYWLGKDKTDEARQFLANMPEGEALGLLERLYELQQNATTRLFLADWLYQQALHTPDDKLAQTNLQRVLELAPKHPEATHLLLIGWFKARQVGAAEGFLRTLPLEDARQLLERLAGDYPEAQQLLVTVLLKEIQATPSDDQARANYQALTKLAPNHPDAKLVFLGRWLGRSDTEAARQFLASLSPAEARRLLEIALENFAAALPLLVDELLKQAQNTQDHEQAYGLYQQVLALAPDNAEAKHLLVERWLAGGKMAEAQQLLARLPLREARHLLVRVSERQPTARPLLVEVLLKEAQNTLKDEAKLALYRQVLTLDPQQPDLPKLLLETLLRLDKTVEARQTLDSLSAVAQLALLEPLAASVPAARKLLLEILLGQIQTSADEEVAQASFQKALALAPEHPGDAQQRLVARWLNLGQTAKAHAFLAQLPPAKALSLLQDLAKNDSAAYPLLLEFLLSADQAELQTARYPTWQRLNATAQAQLLKRLPSPARARLAEAMLEQDKITLSEEEQLTLYAKVLDIDPGNVPAGTKQQAIIKAQRQRKLRPELEKIEILEKTDQLAAALAQAQQFAKVYPDDQELWGPMLERLEQEENLDKLFKRGREALRQKRWAEARNYLRQVVQARPDYQQNGEFAAELLAMAIREEPAWRTWVRQISTQIAPVLRMPGAIVFMVCFCCAGIALLYYPGILPINSLTPTPTITHTKTSPTPATSTLTPTRFVTATSSRTVTATQQTPTRTATANRTPSPTSRYTVTLTATRTPRITVSPTRTQTPTSTQTIDVIIDTPGPVPTTLTPMPITPTWTWTPLVPSATPTPIFTPPTVINPTHTPTETPAPLSAQKSRPSITLKLLRPKP